VGFINDDAPCRRIDTVYDARQQQDGPGNGKADAGDVGVKIQNIR